MIDEGWLRLNEKVAAAHDRFVQAARYLFEVVQNGGEQADIAKAADEVELRGAEFKKFNAAFNNSNTTFANGVSGEALAASRNSMLVMEGISMVTLLVGIALPIFFAH